ncbi:MAG TPA: GC-type dockerin domain-anchored protein [Phycisphaerales bacterium]|nr:GC-type dockerin domain-anchored protein [Phycisphaerales bacterium]HMP37836.1 GC-type dockerin domain-anchored protein [Phycisphaerales bacterium]
MNAQSTVRRSIPALVTLAAAMSVAAGAAQATHVVQTNTLGPQNFIFGGQFVEDSQTWLNANVSFLGFQKYDGSLGPLQQVRVGLASDSEAGYSAVLLSGEGGEVIATTRQDICFAAIGALTTYCCELVFAGSAELTPEWPLLDLSFPSQACGVPTVTLPQSAHVFYEGVGQVDVYIVITFTHEASIPDGAMFCNFSASPTTTITLTYVVGEQNEPACPADLSPAEGDGVVDGADLGVLLGAFGELGGPADLTGDGIVDGADLGVLLGAWGPC